MTQQEYQQEKRECWEEFQVANRTTLETTKQAFEYIFDRAYALGKLQASCEQVKEAITQEEIEKAAKTYASEVDKNVRDLYGIENLPVSLTFGECAAESFREGVKFALGKQEKDADTVTIDKDEYDKLCKYRRYVANWVPYFNVCPICGEYNQSGCVCANCSNNKNWNK